MTKELIIFVGVPIYHVMTIAVARFLVLMDEKEHTERQESTPKRYRKPFVLDSFVKFMYTFVGLLWPAVLLFGVGLLFVKALWYPLKKFAFSPTPTQLKAQKEKELQQLQQTTTKISHDLNLPILNTSSPTSQISTQTYPRTEEERTSTSE